MPSYLFAKITTLVLFFIAVGLVMLFSATGILGASRYENEFFYVARQGMTAAIGIALMFFLSRVKYQFLTKISPLFLLMLIPLIAITSFTSYGHHVLGASRWLKIGSFSFQPSELAKIILILYIARALIRAESDPWKRTRLFLPIPLLLFCIFRQPDLGTTALLSIVAMGMLFIAGTRTAYLGGGIAVGACALAVAMIHSDYRRRRLFAFLNPWADPQGSGFQTIQSFLSFHTGGFFGLGLGNGNAKLFYLPEVHTDFLFSLIGEELGFVGAVILLLLFVYFFYLLFKAAVIAKDPLGRSICFGLAFALTLQFLVNVGGVTGLMPVKGLPLPFMSWGRSALLVNLAMVGILLNVVRQSTKPPIPSPS